jgi:hypothetical protein
MRFDEIGPFALLNRFRDDWIVSRQADTLFLVSVPFIVAVTPFFFGWVNITRATVWTQLGGAVVGVLGPISLFFLWFGMWRYWMRLDSSTARTKRLWFVILLIGFWYGSMLYYFCVYRPQVISRVGADT